MEVLRERMEAAQRLAAMDLPVGTVEEMTTSTIGLTSDAMAQLAATMGGRSSAGMGAPG